MRYLTWLILFLIPVLSVSAPFAAPNFPTFTSRVVDQVGVLPLDVKQKLIADLKEFEESSSIQVVVAVVKSLEGYEIREYGVELAREWAIGQKNVNNGVLLLLAPVEKQVSIEVGYGLEGELTDALSSIIIQEYMKPKLKRNKLSEAVEKGVSLIIKTLNGDYANKKLSQKINVWQGIKVTSFVFGFLFVWGLILGMRSYMIDKITNRALARTNVRTGEKGKLNATDIMLITIIKIVSGLLLFALYVVLASKRGSGASSTGGGNFGGGGASGSW